MGKTLPKERSPLNPTQRSRGGTVNLLARRKEIRRRRKITTPRSCLTRQALKTSGKEVARNASLLVAATGEARTRRTNRRVPKLEMMRVTMKEVRKRNALQPLRTMKIRLL